MTKAILRLCVALGIPAFFRWMNRNRLTILLYHGVRPEPDTASTDIRVKHIPERIFRDQVAYLRTHYQLLSWQEVHDHLATRRPFPPYSLCITFDDGYANHARVAAPILNALGIKAIFYLPTGFLDGTPLWTDRLECAVQALQKTIDAPNDSKLRAYLKTVSTEEREHIISDLERRASTTSCDPIHAPMTWGDTKDLIRQGHAIGAHSVTHPILSKLSDAKCGAEIEACKQRIEEMTGQSCVHFAYPNGKKIDFRDATIEALTHAGFATAITTEWGTTRIDEDRYRLPRYPMDATVDHAAFVTTVTGVRQFLSRLKHAIRQ